MIELGELLYSRGLPTKRKATKLVRHQDSNFDLAHLVATDYFETYQSNQANLVFNCSHIVAFLGERYSHARLYAVYEVCGVEEVSNPAWPEGWPYPDHTPGRFWYKLNRLSSFDDLSGRVMIDWGRSTRSWHQWLAPKEIIEILPSGYVREFPGYTNILLTNSELKQIMKCPLAHREWHRALGSVSGIYLILDTVTGLQYVGSAYGADGILGRWKSYARSGHGGNLQLRELITQDPSCITTWQYSILTTLSQSVTRDEVIQLESLYKQKLGSRAHGLNSN
jgi:hypothetical protein